MSMLLRKLLGYTLREEADDANAGGGGAAASADDDTNIDDGRPADITVEEWAQLSPGEREAIAAPDAEDVDADALAAVAAAGEDPDKVAAEAAAATAAAAAAEEAAAAEAAGPAPFVPVIRVDLPETFDAQLEELKGQRATLREQFKAGDLELDEYEAQRETIDEKLNDLNALKIKADMAAETAKQTSMQRWEWECDTFYAEEANAIYRDPIRAAAHNAAVIKLGKEADTQSDKFPERAKWTGMRFLREADKLVRAAMGFPAAEQPAAEQPAGDGKPPRNLLPAKPNALPPAIRALPVAASAAVGADEFADMAGLEGVAYERAIARMSPEQRERFVAA